MKFRLTLAGGYRVPQNTIEGKNTRYCGGCWDLRDGKWVAKHGTGSLISEYSEPASLGDPGVSHTAWPLLSPTGRYSEVFTTVDKIGPAGVKWLDDDNVLCSGRKSYRSGFEPNWLCIHNIETGAETLYDMEIPEYDSDENFHVCQAFAHGFTSIPQAFADAYCDGRTIGAGVGGYDVLGSPLGPALAAMDYTEVDPIDRLQVLLDHPNSNPAPRNANYNFPERWPTRGDPRLPIWRDPTPEGVGYWIAGSCGNPAWIPGVGLVFVASQSDGTKDYRAQGDSGSGSYFGVADCSLFYSETGSDGNRGDHQFDIQNAGFPDAEIFQRLYSYGEDQIAEVAGGFRDAWDCDPDYWDAPGADIGEAIGCYWDDGREYLWIIYRDAWNSNRYPVLAAYTVSIEGGFLSFPRLGMNIAASRSGGAVDARASFLSVSGGGVIAEQSSSINFPRPTLEAEGELTESEAAIDFPALASSASGSVSGGSPTSSPSIAEVATSTAAGSAGSISLFSSIATNDLLLLFWSNDDADEHPSIPGFTRIDSAGVSHAIFAKKATGLEGSTATFSLDTSEKVACIAVKINASDWTQDLGDIELAYSASTDPPSISHSGGSADYLYIASSAVSSGQTVSGWPSGYGASQTQVKSGDLGADASVAIAAKESTSSTSDDPSAFTWSGASPDSFTLAIPPAAGAEPDPNVAAVSFPSYTMFATELEPVGPAAFSFPSLAGSSSGSVSGGTVSAPTISGSPVTSTFAGTSGSVSLPGSISANDLLLIFWANDGGDVDPAISGFTQLDSGNDYHAVFGKKASGSEGATVGATLSSSENVVCIAVRIAASEWSQDLADVETVYSSDNDPPELTPSGGAADYLFFASTGQNNGQDIASWPTGYSNQTETKSGTGGGDASVAMSTKGTTSASSENPSTYAWTSGTGRSATTAVAPAAGGGGSATGTSAVDFALLTANMAGDVLVAGTSSAALPPFVVSARYTPPRESTSVQRPVSRVVSRAFTRTITSQR